MNNDSFIRWLTGNGSKSEMEEWEQWVRQKDNHAHLASQAKKILKMPFLTHEAPNVELELLRLKKAIEDKV